MVPGGGLSDLLRRSSGQVSVSWLRCSSSGRVSDGDLALPYLVPTVVERYFISHIDGGGDRLRGAVEARRPMRGDGLAQEEVAVWRHGDVDGRSGLHKVEDSI